MGGKGFKYIKGNTDLLSENISGKKVLVLGSGPSATEIDWANKDWDKLITTSFFYLNDDILKQKPIHVTLTDIVDLENPKLIEYLDSNPKCTIAFEPKDHPFYNTTQFKEFTKKYENRLIYYVIHGGKEGVAARLCWLALACEPKKLYICGIDGISKNWEDDPKNYFRDHKGTGDLDKTGYTYKIYWDDFQDFGKTLYITSKEMKIPVVNLGKGKPYNMITNISKKYEPKQKEIMSEFSYLHEKIKNAEFEYSPFKHLIIEDFLNEEHFDKVIKDNQIHSSEFSNTRDMINSLIENGYGIQQFPGCSTSVNEYLNALEKDIWPSERNGTPIESFGITFRLNKYKDSLIKKLVDYLNGNEFHNTLKEKFNLENPTNIITAYQKNLSKYEISPHPDTRRKALTYLLNINKDSTIDKEPVHTHLLKFKPEYEFVKEEWSSKTQYDRCWVPWNWCDSIKTINKNNSIVLFSPSNDTLHAVKLDYDHNKFQRTQLYGNLMYSNVVHLPQRNYKQLKNEYESK